MKKYFLMPIVIFVYSINAFAQHQAHCGTDEKIAQLIQENPSVEQKMLEAEELYMAKAKELSKNNYFPTEAPIYTVPVVFHIMYNSPADNISKAQILDGLRVLNEDFSRTNPDAGNTRGVFLARAADSQIEFVLAKKDPDGNCSDGINRVQTELSVDAHDNIKEEIEWDNDMYLNIWVVNSISNNNPNSTILGYTYRPYVGQTYKRDGILIRHDMLGLIGTGVADSRTLTHEVGHYLGLRHTFDRGCSPGDGISDTPPVAAANSGTCNPNTNSCHNDSPDLPDMIENYMDYTDDGCQNAFTNGQKNVMHSVLQSSSLRKELRLQTNLIATGVVNPPTCQPTANFRYLQYAICEGDTMQFYDETEDGDPTTWSWSFPGGMPNTATAANPKIYYAHPGNYSVSLTVTNAAGTDTKTITRAVSVKSNWTPHLANYFEGFENFDIHASNATINSTFDQIEFEVSNQAAKSGSNSLKLDNFNNTAGGDVDVFITPNIYTLFSKNLRLEFDYAYTKRVNSNQDELRIYISNNCGESWGLKRTYKNAVLATSSNSLTEYIPASGDWKNAAIGLASYKNNGPILVKFEFYADKGNNLFIDNINVTTDNVGVEENTLAQQTELYPNPANQMVTVTFKGGLQQATTLTLTDMYGKLIYETLVAKNVEQLPLTLDNLPTGVYLINLDNKQQSHTQKLLIE